MDTELCLREGVEPLCEIAERHGVSLTFFVNPGRAIDRALLLRETLARMAVRGKSQRAPAFGSVKKLGLGETLYLLARNPRTLPVQAAMVRRIIDGGHEVGLHGGHNHATWQRHACQWSRHRVAAEVAWGKACLEEAAGWAVTSFASPGWTSPPCLADTLASQGFVVIADTRDERGVPEKLRTPSGDIASVPNTLAGEPGGAGYLESHKAAGLTDEAALEELDKTLVDRRPYLCLYDHPFYSGRHAAGLFERIVELVLERGYEVVTCAEAGHRLLANGRQS
ncbi:polysaccharide deacetylase family protein [Wenzhouxiangella sp. XN201]|uniref:polysaccharide deacetylase family protein n=1 Tax=Wenzhouxiangella sp. XN201 TaxID=2710755 RepID=UPI003204BDE7